MIAVNNLTKAFGTFKAVDKVSFSVNEGEIFGLLGPNGAGKDNNNKDADNAPYSDLRRRDGCGRRYQERTNERLGRT